MGGPRSMVVALIAALLAAARAPVVEGRVGEPGAPAAGAQVTLSQGERKQSVRTGPDGTYRFRAFQGPGTATVVLPPGWTLAGPDVKSFEAPLPGDLVRLDFAARAMRVLRGRALLGGTELADVEISAGAALARADWHGSFALEGLPAGQLELRVDALGLLASVEMPPGPAEISQDIELSAPRLESLVLQPLPQEPARRSIAAWLSGKPMTEPEAAAVERLCAMVNLDPAFRLVMVAPPLEMAHAAQAALILQRFLTGPGLVPRERIAFAVGEVATSGHLALLLMR